MEYGNNIVEIRQLLDLYFDGETTRGQERRLKEYFMSDDVPADLLYAKAMFAGFSTAAGEEYAGAPEFGLEEGRTVAAEEDGGQAGQDVPAQACAVEISATAVTVETSVVESATVGGGKPKRRRLMRIYTAMSVAASLMIALGVTWILTYDSAPRPTVYCYVNGQPVTDINIATRQAQMASRLIAGSARVSADGMARVSEASKPIEKLGNTLKRLGMDGGTEL